ncbi:hypothetical protein SNEBB_008835 [Seison nebaliae]|nr:hypothetical protein SNEBB_008835 [Seison nebaliae]
MASCPKCKTTKSKNPNLLLRVNKCGHSLCSACIDILFVRGSGKCPTCEHFLRRADYRDQVFLDPLIDKELLIRNKMMNIFNKLPHNFESVDDYNDYLEMVEDYVYNLTYNIDVDETNKNIIKYREENKKVIKENRNLRKKEEIELEQYIQEEEELQMKRKKERLIEEYELRKRATSNRDRNDELINDILLANEERKELKDIIDQHRNNRVELLEKREQEEKEADEKKELELAEKRRQEELMKEKNDITQFNCEKLAVKTHAPYFYKPMVIWLNGALRDNHPLESQFIESFSLYLLYDIALTQFTLDKANLMKHAKCENEWSQFIDKELIAGGFCMATEAIQLYEEATTNLFRNANDASGRDNNLPMAIKQENVDQTVIKSEPINDQESLAGSEISELHPLSLSSSVMNIKDELIEEDYLPVEFLLRNKKDLHPRAWPCWTGRLWALPDDFEFNSLSTTNNWNIKTEPMNVEIKQEKI